MNDTIKRPGTLIIAALAVAVLAATLRLGYWLGVTRELQTRLPGTSEATGVAAARAGTGNNGEKGEKDGNGGKGKILYYRHPMGQPDTSPVPKKDSMGMDYLPVFEGEESTPGMPLVTITPEKIQKLGVKTAVAELRELVRTVRAVATVQADERRLHTITPKFEGWIQTLYVNTTGQAVRKGEPLMEVYSPDLDSAQHEYLIARRGLESVEESPSEVKAGMRRLAESALQRLRNWDVAEIDLQALRENGEIKQYITLRSRVNGVITEKPVTQGTRFMPGDVLYKMADLSTIWVLADVFEQDLAAVRLGQKAVIKIDTYPGSVFEGKVTFIYPNVAPETRTAKVRVELPNPEGLLKPDMYGRVEFATLHGREKVLAIPESAVLDTGTRQLVLIAHREGRFEPRVVKLGTHAEGYAQVLEGLTAGEAVVVSANFLIDAESSLKAAMAGFGDTWPTAGTRVGAGHGDSFSAAQNPASTSHHGTGFIEAVDWTRKTVAIAHGPIASLGWPPMSMSFGITDSSLLDSLKPGQQVDFEFIEKQAGEYFITRISPAQPKEPARSAIGNRRAH